MVNRWASERGAGTVLTVAVLAVSVLLAGSLLPLYIGVAAHRSIASAADAAALAAADAASGAIAGYPCPLAAEVAGAYSARLDGCAIDGDTATVSVSGLVLGSRVSASARAGQPR